MALQRGPRVELQPLSENLADMVELDKGADPTNLKPADTIRLSPPMPIAEHSVPPGLLHHPQH